MTNKGCRDIVYQQWPDMLEDWIRAEKKLHAMKGAYADHTERVLESEFDPGEKEVLNRLLDYLVKEHEKKQGPISHLADKFGPSIATLALREVLGKML